MDSVSTVTKMDTESLPETYVIFITANDVLKRNLPLYHINRKIEETNEPFNDGTHIIYVNGTYRGDDAIGSLMHDFSCKKADDIKSGILSEKVRQLKESEKGVTNMCKIMQEFAREEREEARIENATEMLKDGSLSLEKIAQFSCLPLETVKQLAEKIVFAHA